MLTYQFLLNDVPIEEPLNFANFSINIKRDPDAHGVMFESSVGELGFFGIAADMLEELNLTFGLEAIAVLKIIATCGEEVDLIEGNLLFAKYRKSCGVSCIVYMPLEQNDCTLTLRNRFDQKVDLDSPTAFDGITGLMPYDGLNFPLNLTAQALDARAEAFVKETKDTGHYQTLDEAGTDLYIPHIRASYDDVRFDSINSAEFIPSVPVAQPFFNTNTSPLLLFDDNISCFGDKVFNYGFRQKGRIKVNANCDSVHVSLGLLTWFGEGTWNGGTGFDQLHFVEVQNVPSYVADTWLEFDLEWLGTVILEQGKGIYPYVKVDIFTSTFEPTIYWEFDPETYGLIYKTKLCPDTEADVNLVNETGSRIVEAITDGCVRMKSDYYGRVDSEPYASTEDGCGSLRVLTSGLKLRNAENPVMFISFGEFFNALKGIDNIGWGIEPDTELGGSAQWVRVEPVEYFYRNELLFEMPFIPDGEFVVDPSYAYSQINVGYQRWETERINGLNEFNSNKTFRTGLKSIANIKDVTSSFVAAGQAIEVTRQQSFADSGAADTTYDNDTFIICVDRPGYAYATYGDDYIVERDNIGNPSGIFSPSTAYNWRIRPRYNLMRWWKTIMQSYATLTNTTSKLFFGSGTGNLLASGYLNDDCRLDAMEKAEDDDLVKQDFLLESPLVYRANKLNFNYPLSLREFLLIKASPYGFINAQCGNGDFIKGYILNMTYNLNQGTAEVSLLLKYE